MVPVVTLVAITIGISGYYIQNQRILREEEQAKVTEQETELDGDGLNTIEKIEEKTQDKNSQNDTDPSVPGETPEENDSTAVQYVVKVEANLADGKVDIVGVIETSVPGTCLMTMKRGGFGPETQIETIGGKCEAKIDNPGPGMWNVNVVFTSTDSKVTGNGSTSIEL